MSNAIDFAKFFIKRGLDTSRNTYDGNMKLQKLLFFSDFISLSETGHKLFPEPVRAFSNGCVIENVRLRYKNDFANLCSDSMAFEPDFSQDEYDTLNLAISIFGQLSARELSDLNHGFLFWKRAYERSCTVSGFKSKDLAIVHESEMLSEVDKIKAVIRVYKSNRTERAMHEIINGKIFFYSPDFEMTDAILEELEKFSRVSDENTYSVYIEDGNLVII